MKDIYIIASADDWDYLMRIPGLTKKWEYEDLDNVSQYEVGKIPIKDKTGQEDYVHIMAYPVQPDSSKREDFLDLANQFSEKIDSDEGFSSGVFEFAKWLSKRCGARDTTVMP